LKIYAPYKGIPSSGTLN